MSKIPKEVLDNLREVLPNGSNKRIANELGYNENYVSQVLTGRRNNDKIIDMALTIIANTKKKRDQKICAINKILNK